MAELPAHRVEVPYEPLYQRFMITQRAWQKKQYSQIYSRRIAALRPVVLDAAQNRWAVAGETLIVCPKIIDLRPAVRGSGDAHMPDGAGASSDSAHATVGQVVVVGCIYKKQDLKPSIIDQYSGDRGLVPPKPRANYCSASDELTLEDESGRVTLRPGLYHPPAYEAGQPSVEARGPWPRPFPLTRLVRGLVTGVIIAIKGRVLESGDMEVDDVCVPGLMRTPSPSPVPAPPPPAPVWPSPSTSGPVYVLLLSGLRLGSLAGGPHPMALQLLLDWLSGMTGAGTEDALAPRVARVVLAGGMLGAVPSTIGAHGPSSTGAGAASGNETGSTSTFGDRALAAAESEVVAGVIREADVFLGQLAACAPLDIMPGEGDPTTHALPQQPMHGVLFPSASAFSSLRPVPNPYDCRVAGVRILGHAGQPLLDAARYVSSSDVLYPGDESGLLGQRRRERMRGDREGAGAGTPGGTNGTGSASMDVEPESFAEGCGQDEEALRLLRAARTTHDDEGGYDPGLADALGAGLASTEDTGAGGGYEARATAVGDGSNVAAGLSHLDLLHNTLVWRHLAPTAPDTLSVYPFIEGDPLVMDSESLPHVLFSGRASAFGTRIVKGHDGTAVRIVCVPEFASSHTAVLLDVASPTLEATPLTFAIGGLGIEGSGMGLRISTAL